MSNTHLSTPRLRAKLKRAGYPPFEADVPRSRLLELCDAVDERAEAGEAPAEPEPEPATELAAREMHCKNCGVDVIARGDWVLLVPPGFVGDPTPDFVANHSYCSGCSVAVNEQLFWESRRVEVRQREEA